MIQAYKCALIQVGLAVCWRTKTDGKENSKYYDLGTPGGEIPLTPASPGPAAATAIPPPAMPGVGAAPIVREPSNVEMPPPPTYELWTFGTPELQQKLADAAPEGVMDQLQV